MEPQLDARAEFSKASVKFRIVKFRIVKSNSLIKIILFRQNVQGIIKEPRPILLLRPLASRLQFISKVVKAQNITH